MKQAELLAELKKYSKNKIKFQAGESYYWSPKESTVYYQAKDATEIGKWTLLHEVSHGLLNHQTYKSDFELVLLEMKAWQYAGKIAESFKVEIDEDHIQDCLDSYRDWQYKRSLCPKCELGGVQINQKNYNCLFCNSAWNVSEARFCRPYRRLNTKNKY